MPQISSFDAAPPTRAALSRQAFQDRLVDMFTAHVHGDGPEPSDDDLRLFALLAADEYRTEKALNQNSIGDDGTRNDTGFRQRRSA